MLFVNQQKYHHHLFLTLAVFKRVEYLPITNESLNKLASWSEITILSGFHALAGILHGPVVLLSKD